MCEMISLALLQAPLVDPRVLTSSVELVQAETGPTSFFVFVYLWLRDTVNPHVHYQSFFMIRGLIFLNALLSNIYTFLTSH